MPTSANVCKCVPAPRVKSRGDVPLATGSHYDYDPVYHDYYGYNDVFFYAWLWSDHCHSRDIHCHGCTIVDTTGADVVEVNDVGFQAGETDVLNIDEPLSVPDGASAQVFTDHAFASDLSAKTGGSLDASGGGAESGGWLSSFADSFGGSDGGGSGCGGDGGGGGCGGGGCGGCGGGCGGG